MTDTGYDPNEAERLRDQSLFMAGRVRANFMLYHDDPVDSRWRVYVMSQAELEDAWRAENDYMKRVTRP